MMRNDCPLLMAPEDVAALLQIPAGTVRLLIRRGELDAIRLPGRRLRIRAADLQSFVDRRPLRERSEP